MHAADMLNLSVEHEEICITSGEKCYSQVHKIHRNYISHSLMWISKITPSKRCAVLELSLGKDLFVCRHNYLSVTRASFFFFRRYYQEEKKCVSSKFNHNCRTFSTFSCSNTCVLSMLTCWLNWKYSTAWSQHLCSFFFTRFIFIFIFIFIYIFYGRFHSFLIKRACRQLNINFTRKTMQSLQVHSPLTLKSRNSSRERRYRKWKSPFNCETVRFLLCNFHNFHPNPCIQALCVVSAVSFLLVWHDTSKSVLCSIRIYLIWIEHIAFSEETLSAYSERYHFFLFLYANNYSFHSAYK